MRVCIDIQAAVTQTAGVGRYTRHLIEHLGPLALADDARLGLFYFDYRGNATPISIPGADLKPFRALPGRWMQAAWRVLPYPDFATLAGPADVYHFPNFVLPPLRRKRSVVTIHDMSYLRFPQYAEKRNLRRLNDVLPRSAARADAIVTVSHFSAMEIAASMAVDPARIHVTHLGVEPQFQPVDEDRLAAMRATLGLDRPYLLTVGTLEPRKNHALAVDVFERLGDRFDGLLAVAGSPGWHVEPILERFRRSSRADSIRVLSHVPEALLPALYSGAETFLFPSFYEGFGLPPLEALACGTPVIVSEGGSLPEILNTTAVVRPGVFDADAWTEALTALLTEDRGRRHARRETGRQHAARYRWADTAWRTWNVYRSVLA